MDIEFVRSRFIKHFDGQTGHVYASPGRINLIGEHTDYNGGFVFPGAVDKGIMAEMRPNGTESTIRAYSIDLKDRVDFDLQQQVSYCSQALKFHKLLPGHKFQNAFYLFPDKAL